MAAEGDVFKYTVSNTVPSTITQQEIPLPTGAYYSSTVPTYTRTAEGNSTWTTDITPNGSTGTENLFNNGTAINTDTQTPVANTSYWWVDEFVGEDIEMFGKSDSTGSLFLMYGTGDIIYGNNQHGLESSAEFEKQFTRNSKMTVTQGANIYRLTRANDGTASLYSSGTLQAVEQNGANSTPSRAVADYYTTQYRLIDRAGNTLLNENHATYSNSETGGRNSTFDFNNHSNVNESLSVMLTEFVENTVRTGSLTLTKTIKDEPDNHALIPFKLTLTNVFGVSGVDVSDYSGIDVTNAYTDAQGQTQGINSDGTFYIKAGSGSEYKVTIAGIPVGTSYELEEVTNSFYELVTANCSNLSGTIPTSGAEPIIVDATAQNKRKEINLTAEKQDENGNPLGGAELELYYRENNTAPDTFLMNDPDPVPDKKIEKKVPAKSGISVPEPESVSQNVTVETKSVTYSNNETVPSASDSEWILPRNDTDYIYFRDYNVGNSDQLGLSDKQSFQGSNANNPQQQQDGNRSWRYSWLKTDSGHSQNLEIGFGDENQGAWIAAQFTKNGGQDFVEYSVWERFVDRYTDGKDTVVWKIQPPDGYDEVRFCLYYGSQCIRTTQRFNFELGKIYHKTKWGKYYSKDNGIDCYWDVPVESEGYFAPHDSSAESGHIYDKRMEDNGTMLQARKYDPTEQKIIFHCNSPKVWHNIHIQFFTTDNNGATDTVTEGNVTYYPVNGQAFPGYMMEPYAYAGNDYRVGKYLTYELTIPSNATHFRINNGVATDSTYGYYTAVTPIKNATTDSGAYANKKNYGNYYCFDNYSNGSGETLKQWTKGPEGIPKASYDTNDLESDYDYIYFEKPSNWNNHVYAYFYGGGNLRADNWQRACYSAWPGVEAAGTEYVDGSTAYHSTTYTYPTTGDEYNGTNTSGSLSPESTFKSSSGKIIYKFRIPEGDRKNYSKVIFNDGLSSQRSSGSAHETGVIAYDPGYLYKSDGSRTQYYTEKTTVPFTQRAGSNQHYSRPRQ